MSILSNFNSTNIVKAPVGLEKWLHYNQPLTDKLKALSGNADLELLSQGWISSQWWDKYALDIKEKIFQREIFMKSNGDVCWYARTIIPSSCYEIEPNFFKRLETQSIRTLIFDEPKVQLVQRITYSINEETIEFQWMKKYLSSIQGIFWVRLAEFCFKKKNSFYLMEILFPKLQEYKL